MKKLIKAMRRLLGGIGYNCHAGAPGGWCPGMHLGRRGRRRAQ